MLSAECQLQEELILALGWCKNSFEVVNQLRISTGSPLREDLLASDVNHQELHGMIQVGV